MERLVAEFDLAALVVQPRDLRSAKLDWLDHRAHPGARHGRARAASSPRGCRQGTPPPAARALAAAFKPSLERYGRCRAIAAEVLERAAAAAGAAAATVAAAAPQLRSFHGLRAAAGDWLSPAAARACSGRVPRLGPEPRRQRARTAHAAAHRAHRTRARPRAALRARRARPGRGTEPLDRALWPPARRWIRGLSMLQRPATPPRPPSLDAGRVEGGRRDPALQLAHAAQGGLRPPRRRARSASTSAGRRSTTSSTSATRDPT